MVNYTQLTCCLHAAWIVVKALVVHLHCYNGNFLTSVEKVRAALMMTEVVFITFHVV